MSEKTITILIASFIGLVFYVGFLAFGEQYFPFNPWIDTRTSMNYDEEKFNMIRTGQSEDEVLNVMGEPLFKTQNKLWYYTSDGKCEWHDFAWIVRGVQFDENDRVSEIVKYIAND